MKKILTCLVLLAIAAIMLSGCSEAVPAPAPPVNAAKVQTTVAPQESEKLEFSIQEILDMFPDHPRIEEPSEAFLAIEGKRVRITGLVWEIEEGESSYGIRMNATGTILPPAHLFAYTKDPAMLKKIQGLNLEWKNTVVVEGVIERSGLTKSWCQLKIEYIEKK